jgi:hypothetical protein
MPTVQVLPWPDPVIDTLGHDPRSLYVEMFLLPTLGPTTLLLARHLAQRFDASPDGFELDLMETSLSLGLGPREGANSPVARALARLAQFDLARCQSSSVGPTAATPATSLTPATSATSATSATAGEGTGDEGGPIPGSTVWQVRQAFPPVNRRHLRRLPASLQSALSAWTSVHLVDAARQRARRIAFVLLETGETTDLVERALVRAGFTPTLCREATEWAAARHDEARAAAGPAATSGPGSAWPPVGAAATGADGLAPHPPASAPGGLVARTPSTTLDRPNTPAPDGGGVPVPAERRRSGVVPRVPPPPRRSPVGR